MHQKALEIGVMGAAESLVNAELAKHVDGAHVTAASYVAEQDIVVLDITVVQRAKLELTAAMLSSTDVVEQIRRGGNAVGDELKRALLGRLHLDEGETA